MQTKFTLRQIEVFLETAAHENISKAANSLAMSQSAASGALGELERQFGVRLFDRVGKRLQLNDLGRVVQARALGMMAQAELVAASLSSQSEVGALKIGATLTIGNYLAIGLISEFMHVHPEAKISLEVANTQTIAGKVANFELDIGLIEGELYHDDLDVEPWREDELTIFASPANVLTQQQGLSQQDLLTAKWILREPGSGTRQAFDRAMHGLLPNLHVLMELQHTEAIKRAVEADLGIACLSKITLQDAFARGSLVPLQSQGLDFHRRFYFILHKQKYRSAGLQQWLDICRRTT